MSANPPPTSLGNKALAELPKLFALAGTAQSSYAALGPKPWTAEKIVMSLGFLPGSIPIALAKGYDRVKAGGHVTVEEVVDLIGLDPAGVLGQAVQIGEDLAKP